MASFHNDILLRLLQQGLFAHPWLAAGALWVIFFVLPHHRRFVFWGLQAPALVLCVLAFFPYDVANVSVLLATTMIVVSLWHVVRTVLWRAVDSIERPGRMALPSRMLERAVAAYLRLDPRAAYWLDCRRLQFGLPVRRTTGQRRAGLRWNEASAVGRAFWSAWFRVVELRLAAGLGVRLAWRKIAGLWPQRQKPQTPSRIEQTLSETLQRVARYWRPDAAGLELQDGLLKPAVASAAEAAYQKMLADWTGGTLETYRARTDSVHRRALQSAASEGRRWMLLREARAETLSFHEPYAAWRPAPDEKKRLEELALLRAAQFEYATWQYRRRFDQLWWSPEVSDLGEADGETLELSQDADEKPQPENEAAEPPDADWSVNRDEGRPQEGRSEVRHARNTEAASADELPFAPGSATGLADSDEELETFADDLDPFEDSVADLTDAGEAEQKASESKKKPVRLDIAAKTVADPDARHDDRTRERLSDVRRASRLLEAALQLPAADDENPDADLGLRNVRLEALYVRHPAWRAAILLLAALFCLRMQHAGGRNATGKKSSLPAWIKRAKATRTSAEAKKGSSGTGELDTFLMTLVPDVLLEQHAFLDLAKWFRKHISLPPWAVLQLAEAHLELSLLLRRNPELRKLHRADAIRLLFEAKYPGLWTWEVGGKLVDGAASRADYLRLLAENEVAAGAAGALAISAEESESDGEANHSVTSAARSTDSVLLVEVRYRSGQKDASKWFSTPFRIGPMSECLEKGDFRINGPADSLPLVEFSVRQGRLWANAIRRPKHFSVNDRRADSGCPLGPGSKMEFGRFSLHIGSVEPATG